MKALQIFLILAMSIGLALPLEGNNDKTKKIKIEKLAPGQTVAQDSQVLPNPFQDQFHIITNSQIADINLTGPHGQDVTIQWSELPRSVIVRVHPSENGPHMLSIVYVSGDQEQIQITRAIK